MAEFLLNHFELIEWYSFFIGFACGVVITFAVLKFLAPKLNPRKEDIYTNCNLFDGQHHHRVKVLITLKNDRPKLISCPYFNKKTCTFTGKKCEVYKKLI